MILGLTLILLGVLAIFFLAWTLYEEVKRWDEHDDAWMPTVQTWPEDHQQ